MRELVYFVEADRGGIATYARYQAEALAEAGVAVSFLCRPSYPDLEIPGVRVVPELPRRREYPSRPARLLAYIRDFRHCLHRLGEEVKAAGDPAVLLDSFREYLSPFWSGKVERLRKMGVPVGVLLHDPVRDFIVGPEWWHRISVRKAYKGISHVFLHDDREIDFGGMNPGNFQCAVLPHGPFAYPSAQSGREAKRRDLGIPETGRVLLSFGQVRDGKQLDLVLQALSQLPEDVFLLVAGRADARSQKPVPFYQHLAAELGLEKRCLWEDRYIEEAEVGDFFLAADFVLLTYSRRFVSASGVLNTAVHYERPVLASAGEGPLKKAVREYPIGEWAEPENLDSLRKGLERLLGGDGGYRFSAYRKNHGWQENAAVVRNHLLMSIGIPE
ncbi:MAG: glycosyltransferase [Verrucomicrobia bacterium]|jgi:glycosyltransferase involved in cell wall biosynthesis|nr:glycosyltransferase [Verrucomicrobiota bacterium]